MDEPPGNARRLVVDGAGVVPVTMERFWESQGSEFVAWILRRICWALLGR